MTTTKARIAAWESMRARFVQLKGREPITKLEFDTIEAAVERVLAQ
jgi:hypothetical protein